jgi:hypothetical protein
VTPSPAGPPPPNQRRGGGHTLLRLRGGSVQFGWLGKKPSTLSTLFYVQKKHKIRQMNPTVQYTQCTHQLRTMTWRGHISSVKSLYAVTPTPYDECTQLVQKILWLIWIKVTWRSQQTAYIHSTELVWPRTFMTELMWPRKVTLRSTKIKVKWLWPVKVTLKVIKQHLKVFWWSCEKAL